MALVVSGAAISAAWWIASSRLRLPGAVAALEINSDGTAHWTDCGGNGHTAKQVRAAWCSEFLIILGFKGQDSSWHWAVMLSDSASPEALRCLRVWFRWRPN